LYVPVYLCEGKGKVVINITVNQKGYVVNASVSSSFSEVHDECLFKAATDAALKTRFNIDLDVSDNQKGSITYYFVAQ
jgi:outer membrane biosynthesis protein TonB